ncbi:MAG: hypothetical protein KAS12_06670, partial [Candidatus Aenigmarchaeota archaeon]|nr:hypothetical protein [Candidatus Aenigmarchaeota archaeon]
MSKLFKAQTQIISVVLIMGLAVGVIGASYMWGAPLIEKSKSETALSQAEANIELINSMIADVVKSGGQKTKKLNLEGSLEILDYTLGGNSITYTIQGKTAGVASTEWILMNDDVSAKSKERYAVKATDLADSINIGCGDCSMTSMCPTKKINISGTCNVAGEYNQGNSFTCDTNAKTYLVERVDCDESYDGFAVLNGPEQDLAGIVGSNKAGVIMAKSLVSGDIYLTSYKLIYRELVDPLNKEGTMIILETQGNNNVGAGTHTIKVSRGDTKIETLKSKLNGELSKTTVLISIG